MNGPIDGVDIGADEKRAALERVLDSAEMAASARARDFLRYVVEEEIAGRAERIKGYTIATEALGKSAGFNADVQSAVRVQAKRLREMLEAYYRDSGANDDVIIELPRGSYVPLFLRKAVWSGAVSSGECAVDAPAEKAAPPERDAPPSPPRVSAAPFLFAAILLLVGAIAAAALYFGPSDQRAFVVIEHEKRVAPVRDLYADQLAAGLTERLSQFQDIVATAAPRTGRAHQYTAHLAIFDNANGSVQVAITLGNRRGEIIFSDEKTLDTSDEQAGLRAVSAMAAKIAAPYGVIYSDLLTRKLDADNRCILDSFEYFRHEQADIFPIETCLRRAIDKNPANTRAMTALSRILLQEYRLGVASSDPLAAAEALALRAAELAPQKARSLKSIFEVRFFQRRFDEAFEAADRALELSPDSPDVLFRVGAARIVRGDFASGKALLERGRAFVPVPPPWTQFFFFLEALERNDNFTATRAAETTGTESSPLGLLARAIMAQRHGEPENKARYLASLSQMYPKFAADLPGALDRLCMRRLMRDKVLTALDP